MSDGAGDAAPGCEIDQAGAAEEPYAWLTTTGRRSGEPRTVELWFALDGLTMYFVAGSGEAAQWVRNVTASPDVSVRLGQGVHAGTARRPPTGGAEEQQARRRLAAKYQGWREGRPLGAWAREALCIAVDLEPGSG